MPLWHDLRTARMLTERCSQLTLLCMHERNQRLPSQKTLLKSLHLDRYYGANPTLRESLGVFLPVLRFCRILIPQEALGEHTKWWG